MRTTIHCRRRDNINWHGPVSFNNLQMQVHLWRIYIPAFLPELSFYNSLLSSSELTRASRYYFQRDKDRFILARGSLRVLLGNYLGRLPAEIEFSLGSNKKPFVRGPEYPLDYNVSHSGEYILIAISGDEIGVDVELLNLQYSFRSVADDCFSPSERQYFDTSKNPVFDFYLLWTRKEALLKATAKGLTKDLKLISCLDGQNLSESDHIGSSKSWEIDSFFLSEDYAASLAYQGPKEVVFYSFEKYAFEKRLLFS